jgi:hypothetical protein
MHNRRSVADEVDDQRVERVVAVEPTQFATHLSDQHGLHSGGNGPQEVHRHSVVRRRLRTRPRLQAVVRVALVQRGPHHVPVSQRFQQFVEVPDPSGECRSLHRALWLNQVHDLPRILRFRRCYRRLPPSREVVDRDDRLRH